MKKLKKIPIFKSEKEERRFWQTADSAQYINFSQLEHWRLPNLKLSSKPITLRIPEVLLDKVKIKANQLDMPYQTLIKQFIVKGINTV